MNETNNPPTFEEFKESLSEIYGDGDLPLTYNRMMWYLVNMTIDGKPLTYEFLVTKFKQHIEEWNMMYGPKLGTKYFPSKAFSLRKNFYEFLGEKWYEREFTSTKKGSVERDHYLFGNHTLAELKRQFKLFKDLWTEKEE